ncbi:hypothetical protein GGR57DRAFT_498477 [Xylariaceae sp. FL1272]|nr:hypothetical protein GGR57DRAFT_498477 [Xylariaceae sp. FL1272]
MQEDFLATRLLLVTKHGLSWECLSRAEEEDGKCKPIELGNSHEKTSREYLSRYWKLVRMRMAGLDEQDTPDGYWHDPYLMWYITVSEYTARRLTNIGDRLPALSSLASLFHRLTGDEYRAGL